VPAKTPETDDTSTESELQKEESGDTAETKAEAKNSGVGASSEQAMDETKKTKDTAARTKSSRTNEKQKADAGSVVETEKEAVVQKEPAPEKKPASKKDTASNKSAPQFDEQAWVIQIGSFSNKDNATKLVSELRTQGYRAYERISGEYSRVYVGPYPDKEAADGRQKGLEEIIGTPVKIIEFDAQAH